MSDENLLGKFISKENIIGSFGNNTDYEQFTLAENTPER